MADKLVSKTVVADREERDVERARLAASREPGFAGMREVQYSVEDGEAKVRNARETAAMHLASHKRLTEEQVKAADKFRELYEQAAIGGIRAFNSDAVIVDTSGGSDPLTERVMNAARELKKVALSPNVGLVGYRLLVRMTCRCDGVEALAKERAVARRNEGVALFAERAASGYVVERFREALDGLVRLWGIEGRGRAKRQASAVLTQEGRIAGRSVADTAMPAARDLTESGEALEYYLDGDMLLPACHVPALPG
jgi:hypothetical protein